MVIPTYRSSRHISTTLVLVARECTTLGSTEIVVVDDGSNDGSFDVALGTLRALEGISFVAIELAKNVGQTPATAVGLSQASGHVVVTMDDDLSFPPSYIASLINDLTEEVDFVVGAPTIYANSASRKVASRLARWIAVHTFETPPNFVFSSLVAYRSEFLRRVDIHSRRVDEIGWMFHYTARYKNTPIRMQQSLRDTSNYDVRALLRTAKPFAEFIVRLASRAIKWVSLALAIVALLLAAGVSIRAISGFEFLPGFPSIAVSIMFNIAISSLMLASSVSILSELRERRRSSVFQLQRRVLRG